MNPELTQMKPRSFSCPTLMRKTSAPDDSARTAALPLYSAKRNLHHADFFCRAPKAQTVVLVGDFNDWNPSTTPMRRMPDGRWMATLELPHGHHQYLFLVDGKPVLDPNASGKTHNDRGEPVSLVALS
jgi:1,4-alpha-glucan branching enzyme